MAEKKVGEKVIQLSSALASLSMLALVLFTTYDVLMRKFFQAGSVAIQELEWHLFGAAILLGMAATYLEDGHVRVDIIYSRFSDKVKKAINFVGTLVLLLPFSGFILYSSVEFVSASMSPNIEHSPDPGGLMYRFVVKSFIPLGFLLLIIAGVIFLTRHKK